MEVEVVPMSSTAVLLLAAVGWLAAGLAVSLVMGRRAHNAWGWLALGALFGPFAVLFALEAWDEERSHHDEEVRHGTRRAA
jgi:hypothetical protein